MTLLLRSIADAKDWKRAFERDADRIRISLPSWVYGEFVPRERDQDGLSVYEVDDDRDIVTRLASAFSTLVKIEGPILFVGVDTQKVLQAGLNVTSSSGATFDQEVNTWHREIKVPTLQEVETITRLFVGGKPFRLEQPTIFKKTRECSRDGQIDLTRAFGVQSSHARDVVTRLIVEKDAQVVPRRPSGSPPVVA